ncbi:MAG: glycoside hydrolase family 2 protein [Bacteroidales bacterium]
MLLLYGNLYGQNTTMILEQGWEFRHSVDTDWFPAVVPGCVHLDQMANNIIPDPNYRENHKELLWEEDQDWVYRNSFNLNESQFTSDDIQLVFEGLDTYTGITLNGSPLANTDNMFRTWMFPVKNLLKPGKNILEITFLSAVKKGKEQAVALPYTLPGEEKVFTRKAQYHYGWDWGPRLVTCGIWRPVWLSFISGPSIQNIHIQQKNISFQKAELSINCEISAIRELNCTVSVTAANNRKDTAVTLQPGINLISLPFSIENPPLWFPNNMNKGQNPKLTTFDIRLLDHNKLITHSSVKTGLRKIELITDKDSVGESFYFRINGKPVFIKGANYIPPDNFLSRPDSAYYRQMLKDAQLSNMNMLRVWGGGVYESDYFYDLCDELGIMVWQDFMFACAMYPGDKQFLDNVAAEAKDNLTRLRNHPCVVLWCGNNEIDEGWHNWGWQKQYKYSASDSAKIWDDFLQLFTKILPEQVDLYDPGKPYWPSSPSIGWGHKEALLSGDSHYWGVWWGMEPFETYEKKVPRFMSEYGFQGFPDINTINAFTDKQDRYLFSPVLKAHQKHPTGYETIKTYMERDYPVPSGLEDFTYISQVMQSDGITKAIEAHRRAKPNCMGTLYWQYNDCWPVVSWSSRDWFGRWKALQFSVRRAFEPVIVSAYRDSTGRIGAWVINDSEQSIIGSLEINIIDLNGKRLYNKSFPGLEVSTEKNTVRFIEKQDYESIINSAGKGNCLMTADFYYNNNKHIYNTLFFAKPKELNISEDLSIDIKYEPVIVYENPEDPSPLKKTVYTKASIKLKAHKLAKNVWLQLNGPDAIFSDNNFDLLPGQEKIIECLPKDIHNDILIYSLKTRTLANPDN